MKPSSFSVICTISSAHELKGLLLSLSIFHAGVNVYIIGDNETKLYIENMCQYKNLTIHIKWFVELDKYTNMNRSMMEKEGIFTEFLNNKANVIKKALDYEKDTLLLDCDIIITDVIDNIDETASLGVSPHFIKKQYIDEVGYYNAGMLWTNTMEVVNDWIEFNKTSRYFEQASIEELVKKYKYFEFGENYNLQCWRYLLSDEPCEKIKSYITSIENDKLYYKNGPLKCVHTHFLDRRFGEFNNIIIQHLQNAKMYNIIDIIKIVMVK